VRDEDAAAAKRIGSALDALRRLGAEDVILDVMVSELGDVGDMFGAEAFYEGHPVRVERAPTPMDAVESLLARVMADADDPVHDDMVEVLRRSSP
jgi:hypothetical protein